MKNSAAQRSTRRSPKQQPPRSARAASATAAGRSNAAILKAGGQTAPVLEPWAAAGLTVAQHTFCLAYLENGFNATQAHLTAHPNATLEAAQVSGHRTLRLAKVRGFLNERLEQAWKPLQMGGDQALARIAFLVEETKDDRVRLAALKVILEQTGKLKAHPQSVDALAEILRQNYAETGHLPNDPA